MNKNKALVLLSGGLNSATCLFWAKERFKNVVALSIDYGTDHCNSLDSACTIAADAGVQHEIIHVPGVLLPSPLTAHDNYARTGSTETIFIPMRNALFLVLAANRAVAWDCGTIVSGACQSDNASRPDFRAPFIALMDVAMNAALGVEYYNGASLHAPLLDNSKAETIRLAYTLPGCYAALAYSNTASVSRARGFEEAGLPDPLVLRAVFDGLATVPTTPNYDVVLRAQGDADTFEKYLASVMAAIDYAKATTNIA